MQNLSFTGDRTFSGAEAEHPSAELPEARIRGNNALGMPGSLNTKRPWPDIQTFSMSVGTVHDIERLLLVLGSLNLGVWEFWHLSPPSSDR